MIIQLGSKDCTTHTILIRIQDYEGGDYDIIVDGSSPKDVKKKALEDLKAFQSHPAYETLADMLTSSNIDEPPMNMKIGGYNPINFLYFKR